MPYWCAGAIGQGARYAGRLTAMPRFKDSNSMKLLDSVFYDALEILLQRDF
jgi:hypothetical protein